MKKIIYILPIVLFAACSKDNFDGPNSYTDGFETYTTADSLFAEGDVLWSFGQVTLGENLIEIVDTFAYTGNQCVLFNASGTQDGKLSKCSLVKQKMAFHEGETVEAKAWYYIDSDAPLPNLFLMDLEEQAIIGAGPGMRIFNGEDDYIGLDFKYPGVSNINQQVHKFPRKEWFELTFQTKLSQRNKGWVKVLLCLLYTSDAADD